MTKLRNSERIEPGTLSVRRLRTMWASMRSKLNVDFNPAPADVASCSFIARDDIFIVIAVVVPSAPSQGAFHEPCSALIITENAFGWSKIDLRSPPYLTHDDRALINVLDRANRWTSK